MLGYGRGPLVAVVDDITQCLPSGSHRSKATKLVDVDERVITAWYCDDCERAFIISDFGVVELDLSWWGLAPW
jgi:hypothetical protein